MSDQILTLHEPERGCGYRQEGGCYLVGGGACGSYGGELPRWVDVVPPIPYGGDHFRGWVAIDLDATLEARQMVLAGQSAERKRSQDAQSWDLAAYGMPLATRQKTGICSDCETPEQVARALHGCRIPQGSMLTRFGEALRSLGELRLNRADAEVARAWRAAQAGDAPAVLAALWRLWRLCPPPQRDAAQLHVMRAMAAVGAAADAVALRDA